jgi:hypothetical protein
VFYAQALNATALPTEKTYANQKKGGGILNKIWKEESKASSSLGFRHQERLHHGQRLCGHLNVDASQFLGMGV